MPKGFDGLFYGHPPLRDQVLGGAETSSVALGDLDLTVGHARVEGVEDALPVRLERQSQALERLQPAARAQLCQAWIIRLLR